jgi:hypothetical protein
MTSDDLPHQVPPALWSWARLETVETAEGGLPPSVRSQLKEIESAMLELETAVATLNPPDTTLKPPDTTLNPLSAAQTDSVQLDEAPDTARIDSMQVDEAPETARTDSMQGDGAPTRPIVKTDDAELCEPCERPQAGMGAGVGAVAGAQMDSRRFTFRIDDITHEQVGSNTRQHADCL